MCAGAILNSRVSRVVYGARDKRLGALGSTYDILEENPVNRVIAVEGPALEDECLEMLRVFFRDLRSKKKANQSIQDLPDDTSDGDTSDGIARGDDSE
jgi:tRNA(adenine34) deaminase